MACSPTRHEFPAVPAAFTSSTNSSTKRRAFGTLTDRAPQGQWDGICRPEVTSSPAEAPVAPRERLRSNVKAPAKMGAELMESIPGAARQVAELRVAAGPAVAEMPVPKPVRLGRLL